METKEELKEIKKLQKEGINLLLKRTNTTRSELLDFALRRWVALNIKEVLTQDERKKYHI